MHVIYKSNEKKLYIFKVKDLIKRIFGRKKNMNMCDSSYNRHIEDNKIRKYDVNALIVCICVLPSLKTTYIIQRKIILLLTLRLFTWIACNVNIFIFVAFLTLISHRKQFMMIFFNDEHEDKNR